MLIIGHRHYHCPTVLIRKLHHEVISYSEKASCFCYDFWVKESYYLGRISCSPYFSVFLTDGIFLNSEHNMDAFGTCNDWSTWSGIDIGRRIVQILSTKMERNTLKSPPTERHYPINDQSSLMIVFFNYSDPPITLDDYIKRLIYYTRISVSPVNLAVALFYLERVEKKKICEINKHSIFRLFSIAYLIAFKHMEDSVVMRNSDYCKIAGVPLHELNKLELIFLRAIDFHLCIGDDIALAQKITRILVPTKISPVILISDKSIHAAHAHPLTPDSVTYTDKELERCGDYNSFDNEHMW